MSGSAREFVLGGQAVIEGVMMKGPATYSVAVRRQSGEIRIRDFEVPRGPLTRTFGKTPLLRGIVTMGVMLCIGYRALQYSADEAMEDAEPSPRATGAEAAPAGSGTGSAVAMAGAVALALLLAVGLFFWLPLVLTRGLASMWPTIGGRLAFNVVDGLVRVAVFVGYVGAISLMKDVRRVFQYHGAEHKVVNAFEGKAELSPETVRGYPRLHPRCGTSFLLFVMVIAVAVFSFIPHESSLLAKALLRLLLLPAIAGISYEVLRLTARRTGSPFFRALMVPGLWLQRLTTREPDDSQVEVAVASFRRVAPPEGL